MGKIAQYAILRFRPYPETGEFANVGVVFWVPTTRHFAHKLAPKTFPRVRSFFNELDINVFRNALQSFDIELNRIETFAKQTKEAEFNNIVLHFTRPRETIFQFSEVRTIRIKENERKITEKLYERYVGRDFVTKEYRERLMEKRIREELKARKLPEFSRQKIETPLFTMEFPLVNSSSQGIHIIKPLAFDQENAQRMFDHGEKWNSRFRAVIETETLNRENILVPIEGPHTPPDSELSRTFRFIKKELISMQIPTVDFRKEEAIYEFANKAQNKMAH